MLCIGNISSNQEYLLFLPPPPHPSPPSYKCRRAFQKWWADVLAGRRERERLERLRWLLERLFADWMREAWRRWCLLPPRARPTRRRRRKPVTGGVAAKLRGRREPCECVMRMLKLNGPAPFRCTHERHMLNRMEDSVQLLEDAAINIAEATDAHDDGGICEEEEEEESDEDDGDYGEDGDPFERSVDTFDAIPGGGGVSGGGWTGMAGRSGGNGKLIVDLDRGWGVGRGRGVLPQESSDGPTTGTSSGTGSGGKRFDDVDDFGEMKMGGRGGAGSSRGEQKEGRRHGSGRGGSSGKVRSGSARGRGGHGGSSGGRSGTLWDAGAVLGDPAAWNDGGGDGGIGGGIDSSTFDDPLGFEEGGAGVEAVDPLADLSSGALGDDGNMVRGRGEGRVMSGGGGSSSVRTGSRDSGLRRSVRSSRGSDRGSAARTSVRSSAGKSNARSGAKSAPRSSQRSSQRSSSKGGIMRGSKTGGSSSKLQPTPWREAFKCIVPECEKTCATKSAWESHMRMHETQREREETATLRRSLRQSRTMTNEGDRDDGGVGGGGEAWGERLTASTPNPLRSSCDGGEGGNGWDGGGAPSPPGTGPGTGSTSGAGNRTAASLSGLPRRALWNSGARGAGGAGGVNMSGISPAFGVLSGSVRSSQGGGQHPHAQRRMSTRGPTAYPVRNW